MNEPTQQYLHECFEYRDGELWWKERPRHHFQRQQDWISWNNRWKKKYSKRPAGCPIFYKASNQYRVKIKISCKRFSASRIIYIMFYGHIKEGNHIDHFDGDTMNNKIENLRCLSAKANMVNKKRYKNNCYGYTGIHQRRKGGNWSVNFRTINCGIYKTKYEAAWTRLAYELLDPQMTERHGK